jgi:hypothetical protein
MIFRVLHREVGTRRVELKITVRRREKMGVQSNALVLWRTEHGLLTVDDLASAAGLHSEIVETFVRFGLIEPLSRCGSCALFQPSSIERLRLIIRLRHDLGVNLAGVGVILELTERIENLQTELDFLRGRIDLAD